MPDNSVSIFISYSHLDDDWRKKLDKALSQLKHDGLVSVWHDHRILPGEEWKGQIDQHLESADIILLLISFDFLGSDYCYDIEMKRAMERHDADDAVVIPIIVRPSDWQTSPFSKCQLLPKEGKPIITWEHEDEALLDVARGIRAALEKLRPKSPMTGAHSDKRPKPNRRLLPYLCDRSDQEKELIEGMRRHQQEWGQRPIVLLMHGDELESHLSFLERIQQVILPAFFNLEAMSQSVKCFFPPPLPARALKAQEYWSHLGKALLGQFGEEQEKVWQHIVQYQDPHFIDLEFLAEELEKRGLEPVESLIEFCAGWPDLPVGRCVILGVSLKYKSCQPAGFFDIKSKKIQRLNEALRNEVKRVGLLPRSGVTVITLPELEPIPRGDVEQWKNERGVDIPDRKIRAWFEDRSLCGHRNRIPMDKLADLLKEFI